MSTYPTHPAIIKAKQQAAASNKMSITQTFFLAHKARGKLSSEASKANHDLRLLVLHANFLDQLMLNLSQAEQEEDAWFNNMVRGNSADDEADNKISTFETIEEEPEIGWLAEDYSDSESSDDDDESDLEDDDDDEDALELRYTSDFTLFPASLSQKPSPRQQQIVSTAVEVDPDYDSDEAVEDDEDGFYALERTQSHRPPSLVEDLSDSDEDDHNPPSPPQPTLAVPIISEKQRKQLVTTSYYDDSSDSLLDPEIYLRRQSTSLIAAY